MSSTSCGCFGISGAAGAFADPAPEPAPAAGAFADPAPLPAAGAAEPEPFCATAPPAARPKNKQVPIKVRTILMSSPPWREYRPRPDALQVFGPRYDPGRE